MLIDVGVLGGGANVVASIAGSRVSMNTASTSACTASVA